VIGYVPNGYLPEEILYASGAIPVGLLRGGDHKAVIASETCMQRFVDTFARAHIGYRMLGNEPLYQLPDLLVVAYTDRNQFAIGEMWHHFTDVPVFKLDVPRYNRAPHALDYYYQGLATLRQRLEHYLGRGISDADIDREIEISNKVRGLLKEIGETRKSPVPPIFGSQFVKLNHATCYADRPTLITNLESITNEIHQNNMGRKPSSRLMFIGSTLAEGDDRVINMLEQTGAAVVFEEFGEGIRQYWQVVSPGESPLRSLAHRYLAERLPPAFFKNVYRQRLDFYLKQIDDYAVDAVVWYSLMYRDGYDREALMFSKEFAARGIPFLRLQSDYDAAETEALRTRVEAFIETIQ